LKKTVGSIKGASTIFSFGFGDDHDPKMLKAIADAGRGLYYYIENSDKIPESFADCIGGLLSIVAQNATLTVKSLNGTSISKLISKYPNTFDSGQYVIQLGDLYSEENKNLMCNVILPQLETETEKFEIIEFTLQYFNVLTVVQEKIINITKVNRPQQTPQNQITDFFLDRQRNRLNAAETIEEARKQADLGNFDKARVMINETVEGINQSPSREDELCQTFVKDLKETLDGISSKTEYYAKGQKK